jgi:hypothetical protein
VKYGETCLKYGTGAAQKTVFSGKLLQFPESFRRNVIKPPLMNRNCLIQRWKTMRRF